MIRPLILWVVACAIIPTPIEGQEPRGLACELGTEPHLAFVHGEVRDTTAELEELLAWVSILLILPDRVVYRLFGEAILELEGKHRKPVYEEPHVECQLGFITAVA